MCDAGRGHQTAAIEHPSKSSLVLYIFKHNYNVMQPEQYVSIRDLMGAMIVYIKQMGTTELPTASKRDAGTAHSDMCMRACARMCLSFYLCDFVSGRPTAHAVIPIGQ